MLSKVVRRYTYACINAGRPCGRVVDAEREVETVPTVGFNAPTKIQRHAKTLCFYDLGGGARIRGVWNKYFHEVRLDTSNS